MISSFLVSALVEELSFLENAKLSKINQVGEELFLFKFQKERKKHDILFEVGKRFNETKFKITIPKRKAMLATLLQKKVGNKFLKKVYQYNFDRVVVLQFDDYNLIFEFFSHGNMIFTDKDFKILNTFRSETWKDRTLKKGEVYKFPKSAELDFKKLFTKSDVVRSLAMNLKIGGVYAEKICELAKVNKNKKKPTLDEIKNLEKAFKKIQKNKKFVFEIEFDQQFDTANLSIDKKFAPLDFKEDKKMILLQKRLNEQEDAVQRFNKESEELKKKGDLLYSNFGTIQNITNLWRKKDKSSLAKLGVKEKGKNIEVELNQ